MKMKARVFRTRRENARIDSCRVTLMRGSGSVVRIYLHGIVGWLQVVM